MEQPHNPAYILSFQADISLSEQPGGAWLELPSGRVPLARVSPGLLACLRLLCAGGGTEEQLLDLAQRHDGPAGLPKALYYLQRFARLGLLCFTAAENGLRLATLEPLSTDHPPDLPPPEVRPEQRYVLSRFACLRRDGAQFVLESPLAHARLLLHDGQAAALLPALAAPFCVAGLSQAVQGLSAASLSLLVGLLLAGQALAEVDEAGQAREAPALVPWSFHDLLFHTRSRLGRHANPYGRTHRFLGQIEPAPAVKAPMAAAGIELYRPDIAALAEHDAPLTRVLEERRSLRRHAPQPISLAQLGEFLYRTARVKARLEPTAQRPYESSIRPYPNSGACYELELYIVVDVCDGLASGLYHYCPQRHQLFPLAGRTPQVEQLLQQAHVATSEQDRPQLVIVLAARFHRLMWGVESTAYALTLKNVGVLYQTMYLVATAMGLAPCAFGGGDSDLFAAAIGTDYYLETSVGEFRLGSRPEDEQRS